MPAGEEARMMIRHAREEDLPEILAIYAPYVENTTYSFEYTVPTLDVFTARYREITAQFPWFVWEQQGKVLGYAYGSLPFQRAAYAWCGEVSIYLAPEIQGKGIGKALYRALEQAMALQGYRVLLALITSENERSLSFHQAMGYRQVGHFPGCGFKFGRWLGVTWMQKELKSVGITSYPPTAWPSFVGSDRNSADILYKMSIS